MHTENNKLRHLKTSKMTTNITKITLTNNDRVIKGRQICMLITPLIFLLSLLKENVFWYALCCLGEFAMELNICNFYQVV